MNRYTYTLNDGACHSKKSFIEEPHTRIYNFFDAYSTRSIRENCLKMLTGLIETEMFMGSSKIERSNMLFFFHQLQLLLEANYAIYERIYSDRQDCSSRRFPCGAFRDVGEARK